MKPPAEYPETARIVHAAAVDAPNLLPAPSAAGALASAIDMWAKSTTRNGERLDDLLRDKARVVRHFFAFVGKRPQDVTPLDVQRWLDELREHGIPRTNAAGELVAGEPYSTASVYAAASRVSSFYRWLQRDERLRADIPHNPVELSRPNSPRAYEGSQALTDDELAALLGVVKANADAGELVAKRDYALLLFFVLTGHRREEVLRLKWGNLKRNGVLSVRFLNKGGDYTSEEVNLACWDALVDYLRAAGRLDAMTPDSPLWTAHDRSGLSTGSPLSSHSFAKNLKRYAAAAGLGAIHVHQLRHTFARQVGEDEGDLTKVQHALGHKNQSTTRVYLPRVTTKRDTFSAGIARRLGLDGGQQRAKEAE